MSVATAALFCFESLSIALCAASAATRSLDEDSYI